MKCDQLEQDDWGFKVYKFSVMLSLIRYLTMRFLTCNQSSARVLQAEGVQVVAVRGLPGGSRSVGEDEDSDGRHQQGAREAVLWAGGPVRSEAHAGRQPGHGGRWHHLPHLRASRKTTVWCHGLWEKRWFILTCYIDASSGFSCWWIWIHYYAYCSWRVETGPV